MRFFNRSVVLLICCTFFLVSCSKDDEDENKENIAFSPIELPALRNGADDIFLSPTTTFNGQQVITYSMEYDKSKKHARWVAFKYYNVQDKQIGTVMTGNRQNGVVILGNLIRIFPRLINGVQSDFGKQGYDRGHICASSDRLYSKDANEQTFYYSNMSPQKNYFNGTKGIWNDLEGKVRTWGAK